jgi:hypothetical protein
MGKIEMKKIKQLKLKQLGWIWKWDKENGDYYAPEYFSRRKNATHCYKLTEGGKLVRVFVEVVE